MPGASLSKWPSAVMISGMVQDGILSYDDKANKYLKYWATDEQDHRSGVTLRQLLSFTSGLQTDSYLPCFRGFDACAQEMYAAGSPRRSGGRDAAAYHCCPTPVPRAFSVVTSPMPTPLCASCVSQLGVISLVIHTEPPALFLA